jgi:hypothetical protein
MITNNKQKENYREKCLQKQNTNFNTVLRTVQLRALIVSFFG